MLLPHHLLLHCNLPLTQFLLHGSAASALSNELPWENKAEGTGNVCEVSKFQDYRSFMGLEVSRLFWACQHYIALVTSSAISAIATTQIVTTTVLSMALRISAMVVPSLLDSANTFLPCFGGLSVFFFFFFFLEEPRLMTFRADLRILGMTRDLSHS